MSAVAGNAIYSQRVPSWGPPSVPSREPFVIVPYSNCGLTTDRTASSMENELCAFAPTATTRPAISDIGTMLSLTGSGYVEFAIATSR